MSLNESLLKKLLKLALSVSVSFAILAFLLNMFTSGLTDAERPSVFDALKVTSLSFIVAYVILYLIGLFIRAIRYRLLIQISGEQNVPTLSQMALVTGIRNMIVDMLPARLGELGYIGLLNRGYGVKLQHCASSLGVAVAFDFIALIVIALLVLIKQAIGGGIQGWAVTAFAISIIISFIAVVGLFWFIPLLAKWGESRFGQYAEHGSQALTRWQSLLGKTNQLLQSFNQSLVSVNSAGKTPHLLFLSVLVRLFKYGGLYLLFKGVVNSAFPELANLSLETIISALIGGEIGASLPIPTFMSFGAYEAGSSLVFHLLGVADQAQTFVTMLCVHIWSQCMEYFIGGVLLILFIILKRKVKPQNSKHTLSNNKTGVVLRYASYIGGVALLGVSSLFLAYQIWAGSKLGALSAPSAGQVAENELEWKALSKKHVSRLDGFVVFASNRDGNHDIFRLNLKNFNLSKLTTHPHTETYPRISPDGKRIVFSRSQQPWVPLRNVVAWDIYVMDISTGKEQKLGTNGTAPNWIDNHTISYVQDAVRLVKVNTKNSQSETIYETGEKSKMPQNSHIHNAQFNPATGQVIFTGRQSKIGMNTGHWGTAITKKEKNSPIISHQGVFNGCELTWNKQGTSLFQVTPGGREGKFIRVNPQILTIEPLLDLEGEFSHEYWPKDSNTGEYLVFGASRSEKEHEHDSADYEIFLWAIGSDPTKATRLTFHTGNDSWPDVYMHK